MSDNDTTPDDPYQEPATVNTPAYQDAQAAGLPTVTIPCPTCTQIAATSGQPTPPARQCQQLVDAHTDATITHTGYQCLTCYAELNVQDTATTTTDVASGRHAATQDT